jgi:UDP-glucose 4-epimerase
LGQILVTGGAGYIGSHIVRRLREEGREVVVLDDLSEGHRPAVPDDVRLVQADFADGATLDELLGGGAVAWVVHMAASCLVGESVSEPAAYYENNLTKSLALLDAARRHGVRGMVFSSTAAVYGEPEELPIDEGHPQVPTNTYGETKLAFERALHWYQGAYGFRWVAPRYFNAAGAHPDGDIGEHHLNETHLIPRLLQSVMEGGEPTPIFGSDWPTSDGTCVRDYVHVVDLAEAHVLAIDKMEAGEVDGEPLNLGNGEGFSVREVIDTVGQVTGTEVPTVDAPRRAGDPAILVASSERARERLGWVPRFPALRDIVETAWAWHRTHPQGYADRTD